MGDGFKGPIDPQLPLALQQGIRLHRQLDRLSDDHPAHRRSQARLPERLGRYRGPLVDVLYDHLLAVHFTELTGAALPHIAQRGYDLLTLQGHYLPLPVATQMRQWVAADWLAGYATVAGFHRAVGSLQRRSRYAPNFQILFETVEQQSATFCNDLSELLPYLQKQVATEIPEAET